MLKKIFNTAVQAGEDIGYGVLIGSMGTGRRIRANIYTGIGLGTAFMGVAASDPSMTGVGAIALGMGTLMFWDAGSTLRRRVEAQPKI